MVILDCVCVMRAFLFVRVMFLSQTGTTWIDCPTDYECLDLAFDALVCVVHASLPFDTVGF